MPFQILVTPQLIAGKKRFSRVFVENRKILAKYETLYFAAGLLPLEIFARLYPDPAAFACRPVAMYELDGGNAKRFGIFDIVSDFPYSFVNSRHSGLDVDLSQ